MSIAGKNKMTILGIETSCDETALCILETSGSGADFQCRVIASLVHSQAELHSAYGGVYPNLAKREHGKNITSLLHNLLIKSKKFVSNKPTGVTDYANKMDEFRRGISPQNPELFACIADADFLKEIPSIDAIAVTEGPGLEPALWVGITFARVLSILWDIPVLRVDHMEGHIVGSLIHAEAINGVMSKLYEAPLPAIALLISGGHTELIKIEGFGKYEILGETKDDAVGEAFDKAARLLGLPYPGGPHLSKLANEARMAGIEAPEKLPRPMLNSNNLDFSFSGLKTAVLYATRKAPRDLDSNIEDGWKKGLAREFEDAVTETLDTKLRRAIDMTGAKSIILGGGVSANISIRERLTLSAKEYNIPILLPHTCISGDNAIMIALSSALSARNNTAHEIRARGTRRLTDD